MQVCFIAGTLGRGGAERQLVYMLRALQNKRIHSRVLCLTKGEAFEDEIEQLGVEVEWVGSSSNRMLRLLNIIANIRKRPVDVLQSSHFYTNIYAGAAGMVLGIPSIGAIRNDLISEIAANTGFGRWQLRLPRHLIANSELAVNNALDNAILPHRIDLVRNVVQSPKPRRDRKRERDSINILFVGRLCAQKRPDLFIDLACRLLRDDPHQRLKFEMAGDGDLRTKLEKVVSDRCLPKRQFSFVGIQPDIGSLYERNDILILPSDHEGTPNVVLEAMAHGLPIVATNVGGVPDVLNEECGILVEPGDLDGLCAATMRLVCDADLRRRLGRNGQENVADFYTLPGLSERLTSIYEKLIGGAVTYG